MQETCDLIFYKMGKKRDKKISGSLKKKQKVSDESKIFAFLGIILTIVGFLIAIILKKEDKYIMHYSKQGLIFFIAWVFAGIISFIPIISWIYNVFLIVLWIIGIIYSLSGEEKKVFIIGDLAEKISI